MWKEPIPFSIGKDLLNREGICDEVYLPPMCFYSCVEFACTQACNAELNDDSSRWYLGTDQACNMQVKNALPV